MDLEDGRWGALVEHGAVLGRVLAATYSPVDDRLWVLDEATHADGQTVARLIQIKVGVGTSEANIAAYWPRVNTTHPVNLAPGKDGALLLAATQAESGRSVIARVKFDAEGHCKPAGFSVLDEPFVADGLHVSEVGLTLLMDDPVMGPLPVGIAFSKLRPGGGGLVKCF
jgi:hypothetical protein